MFCEIDEDVEDLAAQDILHPSQRHREPLCNIPPQFLVETPDGIPSLSQTEGIKGVIYRRDSAHHQRRSDPIIKEVTVRARNSIVLHITYKTLP